MEFDFSLPESDGRSLRPGDFYRQIREAGPVFWNARMHGWMVCGYDENKIVLRRPKEFVNGKSPQRGAFGPQAMLFHDTGIHHRLRGVWANEMLPGAIERRMALLGSLAKARLEPVFAALKAGETIDLVPVFQDYTTDAITALMDVPDDRRDDFQRWNQIISGTAQLGLPDGDPRLAVRDRAKREVYDYLETQIADRKLRRAVGDAPGDMVSSMVAAEGIGGITAEMVIDNVLNLFLGALDTTVRWMGSIIAVLHEHPAVLAEVSADPGLMPQAFEEVLRYRSVVQVLTRHVDGPNVVLGGQNLTVGDTIYVMPGAANWDMQVFAEPERFDIHRKRDPEKAPLGFGFGFHQCLGMHLARGEVLAFFAQFLAIMSELEIVELDYGTSWSLWGPLKLAVRKSNHAEA